MFISNNYCRFIFIILFITNDLCFCMPSKMLFNATLASNNNFLPAVATWYGDPTGAGSGGACGLENDVANAPYYSMITAGNNNLFKSGAGCGACYKVKCTNNPACSGKPIQVTLKDECPGLCNQDAFHFDLSGKAFGSLAKPGQDSVLRNYGRIDVHYTRVECKYKSSIRFKIDSGSNPYYLALVAEDVNGDGEITKVEILPSNKGVSFVAMQRSWGQTWKFDIGSGVSGPYSIRLTNSASQSVMAYKVIPGNWNPGKNYYSRVNFA